MFWMWATSVQKNRKLRPFSPSKLEDKMCHVLYQRGRSFPVKGLSSVSLISVSFLAYHNQTYWKLWIPRNDLNLQNFGSVTCPTGKSAFLCDFLIQDIKHDKNSTTANILKNSKISPPVHVNKKNPFSGYPRYITQWTLCSNFKTQYILNMPSDVMFVYFSCV